MQVHWNDIIIGGYSPWATFNIFENESTISNIASSWDDHRFFIDSFIPYDKRKLVVQAGGWHGIYAKLLSTMFERVYTFEPHPDNFLCLSLNCNFDNIIKMQSALGFSNETLLLEETGSTGQHRIVGTYECYDQVSLTGRMFEVPTISIDSLNLSSCDLIMLDIENFEPRALIGATNTINTHKPAIIIEKSFFERNNIFYNIFLEYFGYNLVHETLSDIYFVYS